MKKLNLTDKRKSDYFYSEAIKTLRTNIQLSGQSIKTILITSCFPNEGKSDVVLSLAQELGSIGSLIDANVTEPGEQYQNLNETYVVFITENDVLGENIPIYHVDRIVRETGKMFNDQSHIIYVNSQIKDETALGKLMHDFTCTNAKDMYYEVLADRVHYFKEDEKGVAIMCKAMEDMRNEAAREAEKMKAIRMARLMIEDGKLNYEDIAMYTELTLEEVEKIALEKKSA